MDKKSLSERDICTKFITPAIVKAGWDSQKQLLEDVSFTDGIDICPWKIDCQRGTQKGRLHTVLQTEHSHCHN